MFFCKTPIFENAGYRFMRNIIGIDKYSKKGSEKERERLGFMDWRGVMFVVICISSRVRIGFVGE